MNSQSQLSGSVVHPVRPGHFQKPFLIVTRVSPPSALQYWLFSDLQAPAMASCQTSPEQAVELASSLHVRKIAPQ